MVAVGIEERTAGRKAVMRFLVLAAVLTVSACGEEPGELPEPITNNAVALAQGPEGPTLYSFLGLGSGKTYRDVVRRSYACPLEKTTCQVLDDVPVAQGRLASVAVTVQGKILLFGGYTVAEDGSEVSTSEVLVFDPMTQSYTGRAPMPLPVDDSVALVYQDRFVYLISGWHDDGNVSLTQLYDVEANRWFEATPYPGSPVFGHAGGLVDGQIVIADGVAVVGVDPGTGKRQFALIDEVWQGVISPENPARINWSRREKHPGLKAYRMGAFSNEELGQIIFAGGSNNAYNYNGIGYDGVPSQPLAQVFAYDVTSATWIMYRDKKPATMDHRGLLHHEGRYWTMGGMVDGQIVSGAVSSFKLKF